MASIVRVGASPRGDGAAPLPEDQVLWCLDELERDPLLLEHFGDNLADLDGATDDEVEDLRRIAFLAEDAVRRSEQGPALAAAKANIALKVNRLRALCSHCYWPLSRVPDRTNDSFCQKACEEAYRQKGGGWFADPGELRDISGFVVKPKGALLGDEQLDSLERAAVYAALGEYAATTQAAAEEGDYLRELFASLFRPAEVSPRR